MKTIEYFVAELNAKFPKEEPYQDMFIFTTGKRFYKICRSRDGVKPSSAYAFIDKANGDLYRAGSWSAPANYVRGNINDESGLNACDQYGVKYLK
jgi:hypothetical protein